MLFLEVVDTGTHPTVLLTWAAGHRARPWTEPLLPPAPGAAAPRVPPSEEDVRGTGVFRPDAEDPLVSAIDFSSGLLVSFCLLLFAIEEDDVVQLFLNTADNLSDCEGEARKGRMNKSVTVRETRLADLVMLLVRVG